MSELAKLVPAEEALAAAAPVIFDATVSPADKKDHAMYLFLAQAKEQIEAETDEDSPWHILDSDSAERRTHKVGMFEYQVFTRAVEIVQNLQTTLVINQTELIREMDARRIDLFPPDGEWKDIKDIIKDLAGGKSGSRAHDILRMTGQIGRAFEEAGVDARTIAEIIQAHAGERGDGTSILASMAGAASKVLKDHSLKPKEKKAKLKEIAQDALVMSVNDLEARYSNRLVPRLPYQEQTEDDGSTLFIFYARIESQADLLRGRMQDAMLRVDGLGVELFRPVTPGQILKAKAEVEQALGTPDEPAALECAWAGLLKAVVLADRVCRVVYGMMEAGKGPFDKEHFMRHTDYTPREIDQALADLVRYGLCESWKVGMKALYSLATS